MSIVYPKDGAGRPEDGPWFTTDSIKFLDSFIKKDTKILEFGSGRSTVWMAKRSDYVISVEDDLEWAQWVRENALNATVISSPLLLSPAIADNYPDEYFDLIILDSDSPTPGEDVRVKCAEKSIRILKKGGILFLDNAERAFYRPVMDRSGNDYSKILYITDGWEIWFTNERPMKQHGNWYTVWWVRSK